MLHKSNGMFLLVAFHMESLAQEDNLCDLKENLKHLSEELDSTYMDTLRRISNQERKKVARAEQVLYMIECVMRPLQLRDLLQLIAIRPSDQESDMEAPPQVDPVLSACCGLVTVKDEDNNRVVKLVHYTAEEYFKHHGKFPSWEAHRQLAGSLVTFLSFQGLRILRQTCTAPVAVMCTGYMRGMTTMLRIRFLNMLFNLGETMHWRHSTVQNNRRQTPILLRKHA